MKTRFPREFYIPKSYQERKSPHEGSTAVAYVATEGRPAAMGFIFDRAKPEFNYAYASAERLEKHLAEFFDSAKASESYKVERDVKRKAERATPHPLKVGDILVSSWGYDQTNVDFYQVVSVPSAHFVEIRPIGGKTVEDSGNGYDRGNCVADPDHFTGPAFRKRASHSGTVVIESYRSAYPWDGRPRYWSSYA